MTRIYLCRVVVPAVGLPVGFLVVVEVGRVGCQAVLVLELLLVDTVEVEVPAVGRPEAVLLEAVERVVEAAPRSQHIRITSFSAVSSTRPPA